MALLKGREWYINWWHNHKLIYKWVIITTGSRWDVDTRRPGLRAGLSQLERQWRGDPKVESSRASRDRANAA